MKKILIIRFSSLGDIIMATALPRVLRAKYPDAQIDMVVRDDFFELIKNNPHINNKISFPKKDGLKGLIKFTKKIREEKYDLIIDAHKKIRSIFITSFSGSKILKINKRTLLRWLLIYLKINFFKNKIDYQIEEYIKPLKKLNVLYDHKGTELFIPDDIKNKINQLLQKTIPNFKLNKKIIGFVPSAHWAGKRWPYSKFDELAKLLHQDFDIVIVGGSKDDFCNQIANKYPNVYSFAGKASLLESAYILSECNLVVANDTGMMHVAEAVGTDVITIIGPTSVEFACYPHRIKSKTVELNMWCRPCSTNGSGMCIRFGKRPCLNNISSNDVYNEVLKYFRG